MHLQFKNEHRIVMEYPNDNLSARMYTDIILKAAEICKNVFKG